MAPAPLWPEDVDFFEKDPPEDVLVAELDGAVVGYVKLRRPTALPSHRHVLQVNGLAVDPAAQRDVLAVLARVNGPIVGADIVEYNPTRDINGVTAVLAAKLVREVAALAAENAR